MIKNMLARKLKINEGQKILVINNPKEYLTLLGPLPNQVIITEEKTGLFDAIHLFVKNQNELAQFGDSAIKMLKPGGLIWIFFPKKTSKIQTDLTRDVGWDSFLKHDLQWKSLISFDKTWSVCGLKNEPQQEEKKSKSVDKSIIDQFISHEKRSVIVPEDLKKAFKQHKAAEEFFSSLSFTNRKEYVVWLVTAKHESTRLKRLNLTIEKLNNNLKNPSEKSK